MRWTKTFVAGVGATLGTYRGIADAIGADHGTRGAADEPCQIGVRVAVRHPSAASLAADALQVALTYAYPHPDGRIDASGSLHHAAPAPASVTANTTAVDVHAAAKLPPSDHPITTVADGRHSVIHALAAAATSLHAGAHPPDHALVTAAGFCPPGADRWAPDRDRPLGDGAAAVVLTRRPANLALLATATHTDTALPRMRAHGAPQRLLEQRARNVVERPLATALRDAGVDTRAIRYVITPFAPRCAARAAYLSRPPAHDRHVAPFTELSRTTGDLGPAEFLVGLHLVDGALDPGDVIVLLADSEDGGTGAAAVLRA